MSVAETEDYGIPFEEKMQELTAELEKQFAQSKRLEQLIKDNLLTLGYSIE